MEEQTQCDKMGKTIHRFYFIKIRPSPEELAKEEQYQLMTLARLRISKELEIQKEYKHQINRKLTWCPNIDRRIELKKSELMRMREIMRLESYDLGEVEPSEVEPSFPVPRTNGFLRLPGKYDAQVRPDQKRFQEKLIMKGKMDMEYLQQFQEELLAELYTNKSPNNNRPLTPLASKKLKETKSSGTQELNDMIRSMEHRIQHGNKKRSDEMKIHHEIRNFYRTKEIYSEPDPEAPETHRHWYSYNHWYSYKPAVMKFDKRSVKSRINNLLDDIERDQIKRNARVTQLLAELQPVTMKIKSLKRELEVVNSKILKASERAYDHGEQKKETKSSYNDYQSLMTHVKELAQKGDVAGLNQVCNTQIEGFLRQWNDNKSFRDGYEKRKLALKA